MVLDKAEIKDVPLVISKTPLKKLEIMLGSRFKNTTIGLKILVIKLKKPTLYNSFIITEKKIINPAILTMVSIDEIIAFVTMLTMPDSGFLKQVE